MMKRRYLVTKPDGNNTRPLRLLGAKRKVRSLAAKKAPDDARFRLKIRGDEFSTWRKSLSSTMDRWTDLLKNRCQVGDVLVLDISDQPYSILTRVVDIAPPLIQTEGNSDIDTIWTYIKRDLNTDFRNGGICNRRYIDGTTTWTQHSPWPPPDPGSNALDIFLRTMEQMYDLSNKLVAAANQGKLQIGRLIIGAKQWTPGSGWHYYGGNFHRHIHVEGLPTRTGAPRASCP